MNEPFAEILASGGKSNSLGRTNEVIECVLKHRKKVSELYDCLYSEDAWIRMRAADALEKVCRQHPEWIEPLIDRILVDFSRHPQASIQWHLAQIFSQVDLTKNQKLIVIIWLKALLSKVDIDWIVAANAMETLVQFTRDGTIPKDQTYRLLSVQLKHNSKSVVKRAKKLLIELGTP